MRGDGVDQPGDDGGEHDVAVEVAPLGDGAGHDRGASGRESALVGKEKKMQSFCFSSSVVDRGSSENGLVAKIYRENKEWLSSVSLYDTALAVVMRTVVMRKV